MKLVVTGFILLGIISNAHAFGKRRPADDTQAFPTRVVSVGSISMNGFKLPDGKNEVDMSQALPILMRGALGDGSSRLRVTGADAPASRYVITGGVTSFVADIASLGITFGYKPQQGDVGQGHLTGGEGSVKVHIGDLEMDLQIVDTKTNLVVAAKHASANDIGLELNAMVNFADFDTGARFVYDSPITPFFRKVLQKIVAQMVAEPKTNFYMDWSTQISRIDASKKEITLPLGMRDSIEATNVFSVYDEQDRRIGEIRVSKVDLDSSTAAYKDDASGALFGNTRIGDGVKIYFKEVP